MESDTQKDFDKGKLIEDFLLSAREPTILIYFQSVFRKSLLVTAASFCEKRVKEILRNFFAMKSNGNPGILIFFEQTVISRGYHSLFDWDSTNANRFYSFFGEEFKTKMITLTKTNPSFEKDTKSFLKLGQSRNHLVHKDFGSFDLQMTDDEIMVLYNASLNYMNRMEEELANIGGAKTE